MTVTKDKFIKDADQIAFDKKHRATIRFNISRYDAAVERGKQLYSNLELARERGSWIKQKVINNLHDYLIEFEKNMTVNGAEVIWAENGDEAIQAVQRIIRENEARLVVKSKSMTTEEIDFNEHVEHLGIESLETDLGEYIVQIAGEKPYHIVTPAMHKSKEDIAALFHEKYGTPEHSSPEFITAYVRNLLRNKFMKADIGVTGSNFLIADIGGIALTENEGNAVMTFSFPKVHIAIAGIEKVIPSVKDLGLLWPLLAVHGTGQNISVYNSIVTGPRKNGETDGPEKMYVILMDNRRSELYDQDDQYSALKCIRCGACLNACPIYKNIGGYTYSSTYSGPIGSVITPFLKDMDEFNHLSSACSVCGKCTEICPVKIPLHNLLLYNRRDAVEQGFAGPVWNMGMKAFEYAFMNRKRLDAVGGKLKNRLARMGRNALGDQKEIPQFAERSFSQQWKSKK
ncbi:MAG: LutB/LldF family L-lactate oxidation iron-sulfur protein [Mangrovibacterium sp.]